MKRNIIIFVFIVILGICILQLGIYLFVVSGAFAIFMPKPPEPQITYGEFPFTITYEKNNQVITYEDVIVCEYEGIENLGTGGKKRKWNRKLKSGNKHITLLRSKTSEGIFEIYKPMPGLPEYYMGDFQQSRAEYERNMKDDRYLGYKQNDMERSITKEELWAKYNIRIISIDCSKPIENSFGGKN